MLNRSTIAISVNSPLFTLSYFRKSIGAAGPPSRTEVVFSRPGQLSAANTRHEPRRTAPFPNGDVTTGSRIEPPSGEAG
jgi:hypothetical protein